MAEDFLAIQLTSLPNPELVQINSQQNYLNQVTTGFPSDSMISRGAFISLQMITKYLLTETGSNAFYPDEGTSLPKLAGQVVTSEIIRNLTIELTNALNNVYTKIDELQTEYNFTEDEKITGINLVGINFDQTNTTLSVTITLVTNQASIPIVIKAS